MSAGAPDPAESFRPTPDLDLGEAVELLRQLVDAGRTQHSLTAVTNDLLRAQASALIAGGHSGGGTGGGAGGGSKLEAQLAALIDAMSGKSRYKHAPKTGWQGVKQKAANWYKGTRSGRFGRFAKSMTRRAARLVGVGKKTAGRMGAVAGFAGKTAGAVADFGAALIRAHGALVDWTESAMETAKRLSQVSGSMAVVTSRREVEQVQRDIKRGDATAASADRLQRAEGGRKDEDNRVAIAIDNVSNDILAFLNAEIATPIMRVAGDIAGKIDEISKWLTGRRDPEAQPTLGGISDAAEASLRATRDTWGSMMDVAERDARDRGGVPAMGGATAPGAGGRP